MKNNNANQLWTFVGVAVVVAVIASIITVSVTGNLIRVSPVAKDIEQVYTKAEIDAKLKGSSIPIRDNYKFEQASTKLFLNKSLNDIKSGFIGSSEMPNFLKEVNTKSFSYNQEISIDKNLVFNEFSDKDYKEGEKTLGIWIRMNEIILSYALEFKKTPTFKELMNQEIYFLGKEYLVTSVVDNSLTLMDKDGNILVLKSGEYLKFNGVPINDGDKGIYGDLKIYQDKLHRISIVWKTKGEHFLTQENNLIMPMLNNQIGLRFEGTSVYEGKTAGNVYLYGLSQ